MACNPDPPPQDNDHENTAGSFFNELADCYDAECRLIRALPRMAGAASHRELKKAFELQLKEAEGHVRKIQNVFECFDRKPRWKTCEVVIGMLRECDDMVAAFEGSPAVDAVLIVAIERIAHYQMASDRCLQEWALELGNKKAPTEKPCRRQRIRK